MPRSVLIIIIATCSLALVAFVGFAAFLGPADHLGGLPWADPSRSAPQGPLLVPQDMPGGGPQGLPAPSHSPSGGQTAPSDAPHSGGDSGGKAEPKAPKPGAG